MANKLTAAGGNESLADEPLADGSHRFRPAPPQGLMTVVENVYHQQTGEGPMLVDSRFSRVTAAEQPWARRLKVGEDWQTVDLGWLKDAVGMLCLENTEGKVFQTMPSAAELAAVDGRVVEVCLMVECLSPLDWRPFLTLPPGESARFRPAFPNLLRLRCRAGRAAVQLTALPQ